MGSLDRIIEVNISRLTKSVSQKGFGTALFLAEEAEKPVGQTTRVRVYTKDSYADDFTDADEVYKALQSMFSASPSPVEVYVGYVEGIETIGGALDAIYAEKSDFYAVAMYDATTASQELMAAWVRAKRMIGALRSADAGILDVTETDIAFILKAATDERNFVLFNETDGDYAEMAWLGKMLPKLPGQATWAFKSLSGITFSNLSATSISNADSKNANYYHEVGGQNITWEGKMASGEYIDIMRGVDFLHARIQEAVYAKMVNLDKIPYTNKGADIIVNEIDGVLSRAIKQGIIANDPAYTVTRPDVADVAFNDRVARFFPDINFEATLQGAIHTTRISGSVTV